MLFHRQWLIDEGGYCLDQVYNCDETGLYWKHSPKSTLINKKEKQAPGEKMAKDKLSDLLTCNATGIHRMKPLVIYKFKQSWAYKGTHMNELDDIYWAPNTKGYMNMVLSAKRFDEHFVPDALCKCRELNPDGKVLLFTDNAPSHACYLDGRHPDVQVCFLPPNTTSKIELLDQKIIANVKLIYYKPVYDEMHRATDTQDEVRDILADDDVEDMLLELTEETAVETEEAEENETETASNSAIISMK